MEIIKELNKDDGIEFIKNGSITHAMNIVVSKDGNSIENEKSLETIVTLDEDLKIVGIIPCATELVIFCDNNSIYRFDEKHKNLIKLLILGIGMVVKYLVLILIMFVVILL